MVRNDSKQVSKTLIFSFLAMGINYIILFLLTPYITNHLGTEAYGFVSLAKTISNYGIVITSCLNAFSARFITIAYHKNDIEKANKYYSSVVLANVILFVVVLFLDILFTWKLEIFIRIPSYLVKDVKVLFFINIANYMLLAIGNVFNAYAYIKNRLDKIYIVRIISYVTEAAVLYFLFNKFVGKVYFVGIALIVSTCILGILNYCFATFSIPKLRVRIRNFSISAVKDLVLSGIWNSINNVGNLLNSGLDLWVSNLWLSPMAMGELSIVKTVATIFTTVAQLISSPFQPQLLKAYSDKNIDEVVRVFKKQICISGYIVCVITAGFFAIGTSYFSLWTPSENIELLSGIAIVTVVGFLFEGMATPLFYTYTLTLKNKIPCIVTIISGVLNVLGMYVLLKNTNIGLYGVVGTTTVLGFGTYFIFTPLYASHCLGVKWNTYYSSMARVLISTAIVCVVVKPLDLTKISDNWVGFILAAIVICIIAIPVHIVCTMKICEVKRIIKQLKI